MNCFANLSSRIKRSESERGAILVLTALVMLLLLFIAAFATDLGAWYRQGEEQQRAADVGSLNGIAAFDRGTKQYFADNGVNTWGELSAAQKLEAEQIGMIDAVNTIQALLETSGMSFSSTASITIASPPDDPFTESIATLVADDGSTVTITRSFINTGTTAAPIYTRVIEVTIVRSGEQYFSDIIRDAPTIDRSAQSLLSNCGAECTRAIEINPPFVGFEGNGNGDGYGPLLFDRDPTIQGVEEVWAVNHHSNGTTTGQVICMQVEGQTPCPGGPYDLDYQTANRPVEYISDSGKIYYSARDQNSDRSGLACFDAVTRSNCSPRSFVDLFDQTTEPSWTNRINVNGPFEFEGRLYMVSQHGQIACVTEGMTLCGPSATQNLSSFGDARMPALQDTNWWVSNGEQLGSRLYLTQNTQSGVFFHCLDLSAGNGTVTEPCGAPVFNNTLGDGGDDNLTFFSHDTAGNPTGICVLNILTENNGCVNINSWTSTGEISGMRAGLSLLGQSWGGDAISWQGKRTFFAGGNSNYVGCWNWQTQSACTDGPDGGGAYLLADADYTGFGKAANPYGFAQISERCIIGLGHRSVFYSFNPEGFGSCVDATLSTQIFPCECEDGSGNRFGEVRMPPALLGLVDEIYATVSTTEDGPALPGLDTVALHENGGVIDLTGVDQTLPFLWLRIDVDAKLDGSGDPIWTDPITANLQIDVQPTLTQ